MQGHASHASTPHARRAAGPRRHRLLLAGAAAVAISGVAAAPAITAAAPTKPKKPKTLKSKVTDDKGDAPKPSVDLIAATAKYTSTGNMRFTFTMAGPLDFTVANEITVLFTAAGCGRNIFGAGVDLTDPTAPWAYRFVKKPRSVDGRGKAKGSTYSATFTSKELARQRPFGFQVGIYPPGTSPDPLDETDCAAVG